eukprot:GAHX01001207.1.p1 GENE.GAHX01001207.1~~GAHX01001207.1.p1  ORF type:complete len:126 (+),score=13.07 GAHX01001207.1:150-527(+)
MNQESPYIMLKANLIVIRSIWRYSFTKTNTTTPEQCSQDRKTQTPRFHFKTDRYCQNWRRSAEKVFGMNIDDKSAIFEGKFDDNKAVKISMTITLVIDKDENATCFTNDMTVDCTLNYTSTHLRK